MKSISELDKRPILVAIAGPNGAGKTTFYYSHIAPSALRYIAADVLAKELGLEAYTAAKVADVLRRKMVEQRESFTFETVFSDPVGDKIAFIQEALASGYTVVLCYIGIDDWKLSEERVAMRVSQGGHDVPTEKLKSRFPRTLSNLKSAIRELPLVYVFDNSDLQTPFQEVAVFKNGQVKDPTRMMPAWLMTLCK